MEPLNYLCVRSDKTQMKYFYVKGHRKQFCHSHKLPIFLAAVAPNTSSEREKKKKVNKVTIITLCTKLRSKALSFHNNTLILRLEKVTTSQSC